MSYILDALKKAEQERSIGRVPGIGSEHEPVSRRASRWLWVLVLVLALNALLLVFLLWPDSAPPPSVSAPQPEIAAATSPSLPPPSSPRQTAPAAAGPEVVRAPPVEKPPRAAKPASFPPEEALRPLPPLPAPREPDIDEPPAAAASGAAPAAGDTAASGAGYVNLPVWPQVSGQVLSELNGSLHLDVHVYSPQPAERFVLVNMRKYRQGDRLQEGPVVDEITPDSVILTLHGYRFRMQSQ